MITHRNELLTDSWQPLRYHHDQSRLWRTKKRFVAVAAGRGSGKTEIARRRVVRYLKVKKPWRDPIYFYALPTYGQAKRVAWNALINLVPPSWLKGEPNKSDMVIETVFGSKLYVVGLDKPQRIEGNQWDGGVVDESCDQRPKVFELSISPALTHRNGWCWRIGVPKRAGTGAKDFKDFWDRGMTGGDDEVDAYSWSSEDILSEKQLRFARENMDEKDYNEQYKASWETVSGLVFYAFDEVLNVQGVTYDPSLPLLIGSDFNVDPMAWVVAQRKGDELHVIDELWIRNTNTQHALDRLYAKYGQHQAGVWFFGDATGRARKTAASASDYVQIRNDKRFAQSRVYYPQANPERASRFAACNALFHNAAGQRRCLIHPRCKQLIIDLTHRAYEQGTNDPDDYGDVGHITDALGYLIHALFPMRLHTQTTAPSVVMT